MYPLSSTAGAGNDLNTISGWLAGANTDTATGLAVGSSSKVIFTSGVMDLTIRNASTNNGSYDSTARMEVDIYECSMRHTAEESGSAYAEPLSVFATNDARTLVIGGGATLQDKLSVRGSTPFDMSYALSRFGIKIWSKRKYQIANNDQITYQVRDPRRHSTTMRELVNQDGFNKPGWTRFVVLVGKIAPGLTVGAVGVAGVYQEILQVAMTRKYCAKVENWTEDRTAYVNA